MRADMIRRTTQFNFVMLIASLGLGGVSWILCLLTYNSLVDVWPRPFVIGVVFAILAFFVTLGVFAVSLLQGAFEEKHSERRRGWFRTDSDLCLDSSYCGIRNLISVDLWAALRPGTN